MDKIIQLLTSMIEAHTRLLDLAKSKRTILIEGQIDGLQSVVNRENSCISEIQKLEQKRTQMVQEDMTQKGLMGHAFTLEQYVDASTDAVLKSTLTKLAKQLRSLIEELSQINESNQQLIQTSLSYVHYSLGMHVRKEPSAGYGPGGKNRYASLLDAKV